MDTTHKIINCSSCLMKSVYDKSVSLIITSPPYPMIEMWDECFKCQDVSIDISKSIDAFNKMHNILNAVWKECDRVLIDGGFVCINIGDATRTLNGIFQLYSNHSKIIEYFQSIGYSVLPNIIWHKPSNTPNKFMGSGMYPAGAYVTYEHEYILIFRKGGKRNFISNMDKQVRRNSAYFWEERNKWFSDLWKLKGVSQKLDVEGTRKRSASFPMELAYRLISMYSIKGDIILDPFVGTGTTNIACMALDRNSIGVEYDNNLIEYTKNRCLNSIDIINNINKLRLKNHIDFIDSLSQDKKDKCYLNNNHNFLVKTRQEVDILLTRIESIKMINDEIVVSSVKIDD